MKNNNSTTTTSTKKYGNNHPGVKVKKEKLQKNAEISPKTKRKADKQLSQDDSLLRSMDIEILQNDNGNAQDLYSLNQYKENKPTSLEQLQTEIQHICDHSSEKRSKDKILQVITNFHTEMGQDITAIKDMSRSQLLDLSTTIKNSFTESTPTLCDRIAKLSVESVKRMEKTELCQLLHQYYSSTDEQFSINEISRFEHGQICDMIMKAKKQIIYPDKFEREGVNLDMNFDIDWIQYMYPSTIRTTLKQYYIDNKIDFIWNELLDLSENDLRLRLSNLYQSTFGKTKNVNKNVLDSKSQVKINSRDNSSISSPSSIRKSKYKQLSQSSLPYSKTTPMNTHRYSMNFTLNASHSGTNGLKKYLGNIVEKMKKYCPKLKLVTWKGNNIDDPISDLDRLPDQITQLQKYFDNARPQDSGGMVFTKVRLAFPAEVDRITFEVDLKAWCMESKIRFNHMTVQHHNVRTACWLPLLPRSTDIELWSKSAIKKFQQMYKDQIQMGLTWRALNGQKNIDRKDKVYAFHVECPFDDRQRVKQFLRKLSSGKNFPLGVRFRVMDEFSEFMKQKNKEKYSIFVNRHKCFMSQIATCETGQILTLDKRIGNSNDTIRTTLLAIVDKKDGKRVFNSIDASWKNKTEFIMTFRPDKCEIAYEFRNSISTYIQHLFPNTDLTNVLTYEAIVTAQDEIYDPETQQFTTKNDEEIEQQFDELIDDDINDWLDIYDGKTINSKTATNPKFIIGEKKIFDLSGDNDTVSTMAQDNGSISNVSNTSNVSFNDVVNEHNYINDDPISVQISEPITKSPIAGGTVVTEATTLVSSLTQYSQQENRIKDIEIANKKMQSDVNQILNMLKTSVSNVKAPFDINSKGAERK